MKKLNIGCGYEKKEGFINIDISKEVGPDMVVDIEKGLPFKDDTFDYIYSWNVLEEVKPEKWEFVLKEINRVAKDGCILELSLAFDNMYNRGRINHYRVFNWDSFLVCEEGQPHAYTAPIVLKNLNKETNKFTKLWFTFFPFLKNTVCFRFKVIKRKSP